MKKLKIFLSVTAVILLGGAGYLLYMFKFKEYDVADESVKEIIEETYKVELPGGITIETKADGTIVEEEGREEKGSSTESKTDTTKISKTSQVSNAVGSTGSTTKPSADSIKEKYIPTFETLQAQADTKINALVARAKGEYNDKQANGEKIDFAYFYNKYMGAATNLESSTDSIFQAVMKAVEKDLVANGHDKSLAKSFQEEYEAKKKARRDSLLSSALK